VSLAFALRDPARPVLVTTLGDPDPTDAVATELASGLALAGDFGYVVETHRQRDTGAQEERFTVLDLRDPLAPRRRRTGPSARPSRPCARVGCRRCTRCWCGPGPMQR
jgi:hypothetical protein